MNGATTSLEIILQAQRGDEHAFARLFARYERKIAIFVHYHMSSDLRARMEVEDVLQEIFLRAFRDLGQFTYQSAGSFQKWLIAIAGNVLTDLARSQGRQKRKAEAIVPFRSESNPGGVDPADSRTPSRWLREKEQHLELLKKLEVLPEEFRQAILLTRLEGLTTGEMGQRLGKNGKAAALLLHRALKKFREVMLSAEQSENSAPDK